MSLHPIPIIKSVLLSPDPELLKQFYISKNLKFITYILSEQTHHISTNANLVIVNKKSALQRAHSLNGFFIYHDAHSAYQKWNVNTCTICEKEKLVVCNFIFPKEIYHQLLVPNGESWVSMLRHEDIEAARCFFAAIGNWQPEKHGNGPLHYSLTNHGNVFEIYPLRTTSSNRTEFIIQKNSPSLNSNDAVDYFDPDGRKLRLV